MLYYTIISLDVSEEDEPPHPDAEVTVEGLVLQKVKAGLGFTGLECPASRNRQGASGVGYLVAGDK